MVSTCMQGRPSACNQRTFDQHGDDVVVVAAGGVVQRRGALSIASADDGLHVAGEGQEDLRTGGTEEERAGEVWGDVGRCGEMWGEGGRG